MERLLIENYGNCHSMVEYGFSWLCSKGGGAVVLPLKKNYYSVFSLRTEKEYKEFEANCAKDNIRLLSARGGLAVSNEAVFVLYPTAEMLEDLEEYSNSTSVLVLDWNSYFSDEWREKYHPEILKGGNKKPDDLKK